ncbi:hypothetical protein [Psychromonas sp. Urea-02u-13]|uniref:hypothetical protein n=1 Tax=Psychromonas sp. Urea-02u-13 TaxID=2058326 RepID=UPI000C349825|nr:hypothetical protein [Psychromonas sp. Urea-02u-13]PKG38604.1 hypothetical protein CXF74_12865 [Psychromonas sp. Urea-02u-13]
MHKIANRIILVVVILLAGLYFLQSKINSPEECQKVAGVWNATEEVCEQTTTQTIYESLSSGYPITMTYPETDIQVEIDKVETVEEVYYLRGHYQILLKEATGDEQAVYDRGLLYLNMSKMVILNEAEGGLVHYAAPFIINTVGKGVFVYSGLFSYDMKSKKSVHLDSALLGNRIREEKITYFNDYLQVDFKNHGEHQAYADYPTKNDVIYLKLLNNFSSFETVERMHSSWDENSDGNNDCESDGSCDHTTNYSLPRASL